MKRTRVAFLWHMHQPDYRLPGERRNLLPWVRLHATRAYYDMPWLLERHPGVKACVNFSGSLIRQLRAATEEGMRDVWWEISARPVEALEPDERHFLLEHFFSVNWERHVRPVKGYARLLDKRGPGTDPIHPERFSERELTDLQVYFNLAWMGFAARRDFPLVEELVGRGGGYAFEDLQAIHALQLEIMGRVLPMYQALSDRGQIELTTTPMNHPIIPLLIDSDVARRATPDRPMPRRFAWPQDARWHIEAGARQLEATFGRPPAGMWPSEGSVSPEAAELFKAAGVRWIASDEDVLMASHPRPYEREDALYRPYALETAHGPLTMLFRDHILSDLIGFTYASSPAEAAADDLMRRLREGSKAAASTGVPLVTIALDGENPWESYPGDGEPFLSALYKRLELAEDIETVRPVDAIEATSPSPLHHLHSGSWIRANYQIWIGAEETNAAWNLLGRTRSWLDAQKRHLGLGDDDPRVIAAMEAVYAAEGSDWFWWYGDDFSSAQDKAFDSLFRSSLRAVYAAFGETPPGSLYRAISSSQSPVEIKAPQALIRPQVDGRVANYFEWAGAGRYEPHGGAGSMYRARRYIKVIYFGFDLERLYVRFDPDVDFLTEGGKDLDVRVLIHEGGLGGAARFAAHIPLSRPLPWIFERLGEPASGDPPSSSGAERLEVSTPGSAAFERLFEWSVPFDWLELGGGQVCRFSIALVRRGIEVDRHPPHSEIAFVVPDEGFEKRHWMV